ncbi:MAG TPA: hypothetical protein EYP43_00895 [Thermoplasmata archaeon]|nr:hypothetical protein [Thermoplasmata archaeon]
MMNLLRRYLDGKMGEQVLVVTVDGRSFMGELMEYDEEAMILSQVIETSTRETKWHRPAIALPSPDGTGGNVIQHLDEVMILLSGVLRMWSI